MMSELSLQPYRALIVDLLDKIQPLVVQYFHDGFTVDHKADNTPVTEADRQAEEIMRDMIMARFPSHGILGEEYGWHQQQAEWCWVLDPIDGTKSFIAGSYDFGTIIGLTYQGQPVLGAIYQPVLKQLFMGDNQSATLNGKPIQAAPELPLEQAFLLASDFDRIKAFQPQAQVAELAKQVAYSRTWGNCFGFGLVAQGTPAIMLDPNAASWDSCGVIPIIRGAGAAICSFTGGDPVDEQAIIACPKAWQQRVVELLNG